MRDIVKYWMVHHGNSSTNQKHGNKETAIKEAMRLARSSPGTTYTILEVVDAYCTVDNPVAQVNVLNTVSGTNESIEGDTNGSGSANRTPNGV